MQIVSRQNAILKVETGKDALVLIFRITGLLLEGLRIVVVIKTIL